MPTDHPNRDDSPAAIAAAVRAPAADAHAVLTRAPGGGHDGQSEGVGDLRRRAGELLGRVGEGRLHGLRAWPDNLRRRALQGRAEDSAR
jgi:hypothetical protein